MTSSLTGDDNCAFGYNSLNSNKADNNSAFGSLTMDAVTTGADNSAFGMQALSALISASNNAAFGNDALLLATGGDNCAFGKGAGDALITGTDNAIFGYNSDTGSTSSVNAIVIGANVTGNGSNTATIGDSSITDTYLEGDIHTTGQINLVNYTVAGVPSAATVGGFIFVTDETGGAVTAFSDGTNWRRTTDRAIVA